MRKLFRFKYEPCNKTCYAYCATLMIELRKLSEAERLALVGGMVDAHNRLCDNPDYSFGVDVDEENHIFVAHFRTPQSTDLFGNRDFAKCVRVVCEKVMSTEIPPGTGECCFGDNGAEDLGREILKFCTDVGYAEVLEKHCECKVHDKMELTGNLLPAFAEALRKAA